MLKQNSYDPIQTLRSPTAHMNLGRGGCMSAHLLELVNSTEDRGNKKPGCYSPIATVRSWYLGIPCQPSSILKNSSSS